MKPLIFSGTSNHPLAQKLAKELKLKLGKIIIKKFSDGETYVNILENVRNKNVFVLQSGNSPANENLMELLLIIDALKRLKPKKITAILPFYPYRRQERKIEKGEPVSAELVVKLLQTAGVDKVITLDLHSPKIKKFFKIPVLEFSALPLFVNYFQRKKLKNFLVLAPDQGALGRSKKLAKVLKIPLVKAFKKRFQHDQVTKAKIMGEIKNKNIIIIDDEVNTAGTVVKLVRKLKSQKVKEIFLIFTHSVLSGPAIKCLKQAPIKEIITTDTINLPKEKRLKKIKIISVAKILAKNYLNF